MSVFFPDYSYETAIGGRVAGVDEVGRGPLAGPVLAAAVILDPAHIPAGLNDSKKLGKTRREKSNDALWEHAEISIAQASVAEIDRYNILRAAHLAMRRAIEGLKSPPDHVLIDGNMIPHGLNLPATALIRGDTRSLSIAAASIVAKIRRDAIMVDLAQQYPGYDWHNNKGYPTPNHKTALADLGVSPHHRCSFRPVRNILYQE